MKVTEKMISRMHELREKQKTYMEIAKELGVSHTTVAYRLSPHKERYKERSRKKYRDNVEKYRQYNKKYYQNNKEAIKKYYRDKNYNLKMLVFDRLGNRCIKCGFKDYRAFQIDHIKGGGRKELEKIGRWKYYQYLLNLDIKTLKENYQLLCANCNQIKKFEKNEF